MTREPDSAPDRRSNTLELLDLMLQERNQLLSLLVQASTLQPAHPDPELLREFCQVMVDYIAAGHFGLYRRIIEGQERRRNVADTAMKIYPRIDAVTQQALAFNEKYAGAVPSPDLGRIHEDLSSLGEALTTRIELEDGLIGLMRKARASATASS